MARTLEYFGYGANKDPDMIGAIIGRVPDNEPAVLENYALVIQQYGQIPGEVISILGHNWSDEEVANFMTYAIRPQNGEKVPGTLWKRITSDERALIDDWEINDGLWYQKRTVEVIAGGVALNASTEIIDDPTLPLALDVAPELPTFLNDKARMLEVAGILLDLANNQ